MGEILSKCGYRCDLCPAYTGNIGGEEDRMKVSRDWKRLFGFEIPAGWSVWVATIRGNTRIQTARCGLARCERAWKTARTARNSNAARSGRGPGSLTTIWEATRMYQRTITNGTCGLMRALRGSTGSGNKPEPSRMERGENHEYALIMLKKACHLNDPGKSSRGHADCAEAFRPKDAEKYR